MNNTANTPATLTELFADPTVCEWLDSIEDANDSAISEDLHTLKHITAAASNTLAATLQDLYQSDIFTEGK
tara:strand:+ start:390 stop:602 length:213 start_codon:yes stop_codon:yes gene_type:complete